jgi:4-amino-4-deoxy-L-arabinose transferase-like glycosyltransferase
MTLPRSSTAQAETSADEPALFAAPRRAWTLLLLVFVAVFVAALFSPSLLDDADATHAEAAQHILTSGNWVTLYVNGVRYLEKPALPYWMVAVDFYVFGDNVFATHLPMALGVLGCAVLMWFWARRAWGDRAGFYAALAMFTSIGVFLFTRFFIPESILTCLLLLALYSFFTGLEDHKPSRFYVAYGSVALALLAKGLIAPVFFAGTVVPYLAVTGEWRRWRELRLGTGLLLFLAIGAPWHILAGLQNPDHGHPAGNVPSPGNVHGFLWFYFVNEHFLRFLGKRFPHDYNRQPWAIFWFGQLIWLFPWSLFVPVALRRAWRNRSLFAVDLRHDATNTLQFLDPRMSAQESSQLAARLRFRARTSLLLGIYTVFILGFFALSTNQEYYTWPIYPAALMLIAGALATIEESPDQRQSWGAWLTGAHIFFVAAGAAVAAILGWGLWESRHLPFIADVGSLMAHRDVAGYSLATSHFFDLTTQAFAALRLPAALAAIAFVAGPIVAWRLRRRGHAFESTVTVAFTMAVTLIAAHLALVRFEPLLSSRAIADTINRMMAEPGNGNAQILLYGDQSDGSSIPFYTHRQVLLVHGAKSYFEPDPTEDPDEMFGSSMIWGSDYPDAPHIFLSDQDLLHLWGTGPRHFLFVPEDFHEHVVQLLGSRLYRVQELSDKTLYTDRPL